jgi:AmiR/NasT family two-component response regulator
MAATDAPADSLRILAADEDSGALREIADLLEQLGHDVTATVASVPDACEAIAREDPDASIVVVHDDADHALDLIDELSEVSSGPVIALLNGQDPVFAKAAAERGISAIASAPTTDALRTALEVAIRRQAEAEQMTERIDQLEHALERRAVIERAKGILMERHGLGERAAFEYLRGYSRARSRQVVAVARDVAERGLELPEHD